MDPYAHRITYSPFSTIPNLKNLYLSAAHRAVLAAIMTCIEQQKGYMVITGEEGVGKTTLVRACLQQLEQTVPQAACIFQVGKPTLSFLHMSTRIAEAVDLSPHTPVSSEGLPSFSPPALESSKKHQDVVFVIDDAHKLAPEALQQIFDFIMSTRDHPHPVQLLLLGPPSLNEKLSKQPLSQQIAFKANLAPFTPQESRTYIRQQLTEGMLHETQLFTPAALRYIVRRAGGIPKNLSVLCADALNLTTYCHERPLSVQTLKRELPDVGYPGSFSSRHLSLFIAMAGLTLVGLCLSMIFLARQQTAPRQPRPAATNRAPLDPTSDVAPKSIAPAASEPQPSAWKGGEHLSLDQESLESDHIALPEMTPASSPPVPSPETVAAARLTAPAGPPPAAQEQRISRLLDDAQRLWQTNRLTLPQGASAYDRYRAVLRIEPQHVVAKQGLASIVERYRQWGKLALEREQYAKAIGYYQRLLTITEPDGASYYALGSAYHKAQQYPEAMQAYAKALQLAPHQDRVHQAMATLQTEQLTTALQANDFKHIRAHVDADHRVTLWGYVVDDAEEAHILALAQAQPGIEQVINRLKNRLEVIIERIQQGSFTSGKL